MPGRDHSRGEWELIRTADAPVPTQEELQALDDRRKDALWKLSALKERKSDFETKYQALMDDKNALTYAIQQKVSEIEACSRELEALQTESKQKDEKMAESNFSAGGIRRLCDNVCHGLASHNVGQRDGIRAIGFRDCSE